MTTRGNAEIIETRQVGDATITVIADGEMLWEPRFPVPEAEWRAALPDADERGRIWIGLNVVLVRLGDALVVIDPGCDDPDSAWQQSLAAAWPNEVFARSPGLGAALRELGIDPAAVTHVVITHAHGDHFPGVVTEHDAEFQPRFPGARHFIGRSDWTGNPRRGQPGSDLERLEVIDRLGLLDEVEAEREIAPGITIIPAPGETPGHCLVRIVSRGETCYVMGDVIHHRCEVAHRDWMPPGRDEPTLARTRERVFAAADGALVIHAHDPFPAWSRIVATRDGYQWEPA